MLQIPGYSVRERLWLGSQHATWRAVRSRDGAAVVLKVPVAEYPPPRVVARLQHELEITSRLPGDAVVHALGLERWGPQCALVLEDDGGSSLATAVAPGIPLPRLLALASALAGALAAVHAGGVIHKDVKPANAIVLPGDRVRLGDFGMAVRLARETALEVAPNELEGTLAYMAPEQTGRMNRPIDRRADLYALGVTLYELATGALPFASEDPLELVHQHIAVRPAPPKERRAELPEPFSDLVVKLLAKDAEERYQSAAGVRADLEICREQLDHGRIAPFRLGARDASDEFRIPQKLYGREPEVAELDASLQRACGGGVELVVVEGPSGIGKSALVGEITRLASAARAVHVQGKFDQYRRDLPYSGVIQAFGQIARRLLTEPDARLAQWRAELGSALAPNGQVLVDLVPEFEPVLGPQPAVLQLGLSEAQIRFNLVIRRFVRALARAEHPLVLFLDDVQWADGASLSLLHTLATDPDTSHLLVVVALRDREVGPSHPFRLLLHELESARKPRVVRLAPGPLDVPAVHALLGEALRAEPDAVAPLADVVHAKTGGNPFFVSEFLRTLHRGGVLRFDASRGAFAWDLERARQQRTTQNVVDLVIERLGALPAGTRDVLQLAAVVGHTFDLATLARVSERSVRQVRADLDPALSSDILVPVGDDYKYTALADDAEGAGKIGYTFLHDRVHQATYGMIPEDRRPRVHHRVARLLLESGPEHVEERLFDVVSHFEAARSELGAEAREVAALFLRAARKANQSMAWEAVRRYADAGRELMGEAGWTSDYELVRDLHMESLEAAFLLSDRPALDAVHDAVVQRARTVVEKARATEVQIQLLVSGMAYGESLDVAIPVLSDLGVKLPRRGNQLQVVAGLLRTKWALRGRSVPGLADLPTMTDEGALVAMRLLVATGSPAYAAEPQLFPQMVFELVQRSIRFGTAPQSAFGYVCYGLAMCAVLGDYDGGLAFGRLATDVMERTGARDLEAKVRFLNGLFVMPWSQPLADTLEPFRVGAARGLETGDLEYYSYNFYGLDSHLLMMGQDLDALATASEAHHEAILHQNQQKVGLVMLLVRDAVAFLRDQEPIRVGDVDEARVLALATERGDATSVAYAHAFRSLKACLGGRYEEALQAAAGCRARQEGIDGQLFVPMFQLYESLSVLALARAGRAPSRWQWTVAGNQRRLKAWAKRVPSTFLARWELVEGERARVRGDTNAALAAFERAAAAAREAGNLHDEGLAQRLAGECALAAGLVTAGRGHLLEARQAWLRWGAARLVRGLEEEHRALIVRRLEIGQVHESTQRSTSSGGEALDVQTITRAAQAIAGKLRLPDVVRELISLALSSAGGRRAWLILEEGGQWRVRASADVERADADVLASVPLTETELFRSVVQYVLRTRRSLVLDDAQQDATFRDDAYVAKARPRSVLCSPMTRHGELVGAILVENDLVAGAFTPDRVEFLQVIAAQAAISIENAALVRDLERSLERQVALTTAHARFVPHQFLASLGRENIQEVRLGDHASKVLSVLFSDVRGFTPLVESLGPRGSIDFINRYLAFMEPAIVEHGGFVDSYIGDAIMALFDGGPDDAVSGGVTMLRALRRYNADRVRAGQPPVRIGIGVNTGPLMLGTIGGPNRITCGVIGDPVNLAARIEGLTKKLDVAMLIGDETFRGLADPGRFLMRPVERVVVVGRSEPVVVHEVFDADEPALRDAKEATLPRFREAQQRYYARDWAAARAGFLACVERCPDDHVAREFLTRSHQLIDADPGPEWNGVVQMLVK